MMAELGMRYIVVRYEDNASVDDAFVLRVRKDPVAWPAGWHYANLTYNPDLAQALRHWLIQNMPNEATLGSEGRINRQAPQQVKDTTEGFVKG
jgi:hypothetical protein